ncbi:hypothetical protein [Fuerstiella marisgermanici]|uniref:Uncharacterized protein n=1 Tax=Fuerstiella marisgermanici TaxID=1891926 RepID=A0A1P8WQ66_9PLAN|nr:hypothetical protein [Fuerstiella marisgermanici]APZ96201.1 hypothetical protein Fuma_05869 [Fuerstiella marisgermanici]
MSGNQYGDDVPEEYNPFQAPQSIDEAGSHAGSHVEEVRRKHLSHEASLKSVGTLYLLGGGLTLLGLFWGLAITMSGGRGRPPSGSTDLTIFILPFALAVMQLVTAVGLRRLRPWARITSGILSALSLFWIPLGTIMGAYILYLLLSAKGRMVFSGPSGIIVGRDRVLRSRRGWRF